MSDMPPPVAITGDIQLYLTPALSRILQNTLREGGFYLHQVSDGSDGDVPTYTVGLSEARLGR